MIQWLYRYVFRGFGLVMAVGIITVLYLTITSQLQLEKARHAQPAAVKKVSEVR